MGQSSGRQGPKKGGAKQGRKRRVKEEMLYFIPAWYQQNEWCENEQSWQVRRMHSEFDDTVKQVQLFQRNDICAYQLMLLGFSPNFRHFLHRQGVYRAPYWSCFDAIQEIRRKRAMVFSFHNLKWPSGVEFVYSLFVVLALLKGEKYAQIDFGEDGNPIRVDLYKGGKICRRNIYDDRGFVSSTIIYRDEKPLYQDYLMENGIWKMRCYQDDGHVSINPKHPEYLLQYQGREQKGRFHRLSYDNMEQIIYETLTAYLNLTDEKDIFCVAMHERHTVLLQKALENRKIILSFYGGRYSIAEHQDNIHLMRNADYIVADSKAEVRKIRMESDDSISHIVAITPYDSRVEPGISRQSDVQKVLVPVDGAGEELYGALIWILGKYLLENENIQIHLFTRKADYNRPRQILEQTCRELKKTGLEEGWAAEKEEKILQAENLEIEEPVPVKFFVEQCVDELSVSRCMREQRLLVDVREAPELYLQIMAISVGIPQIVRTQTEFVKHGGNGIVLRRAGKLSAALDYYLKSLKNWNQAMVYAYEMSTKYSKEKLKNMWKEVIESIG